MSWTFVLSLAACAYGLKLLGAVIIGQREIPVVLHREIYATAAIAAAIVVVVGDEWNLNQSAVAIAGIVLAFSIRVISKWRGWSAPRPA